MFKFDFHIHSRFSSDSRRSVESIVHYALKKGLFGIAITDHDSVEGSLAAAKYVDEQKIPLKVIIGQERTCREGEILALFIRKEIISDTVADAIAEIHAQRGLAILPHPYRNNPAILRFADKFDFIEVHNSRTYIKENMRAMELAKRKDVLEIVGSDAHWLHEIGHDVVVFKSPTDIRMQLLKGLYATECAKRNYFDMMLCRNATAYIKGGMPYLLKKGWQSFKGLFRPR